MRKNKNNSYINKIDSKLLDKINKTIIKSKFNKTYECKNKNYNI